MDDILYKDCPLKPDGTPQKPHQAHRKRAGRCVYCGVLPQKPHKAEEELSPGGTTLPHDLYEAVTSRANGLRVPVSGDLEKVAKACAKAVKGGGKYRFQTIPGATEDQKRKNRSKIEARIMQLLKS